MLVPSMNITDRIRVYIVSHTLQKILTQFERIYPHHEQIVTELYKYIFL